MALEIGTLQVDIEADTSGLKKADTEIKRTAKSAEQSFAAVGTAIKAAISAEVVRRVIVLADNMEQLSRRVERFAGSVEAADKTMRQLTKTANSVGSNVNDTISIFQRFSIIREELGASNEQIIQMTDTLSKLGAIGGSSSEEISNALTQLSQGLAGGILRAEEFNSIMENTPEIAKMIAKQMGLSMGQIRESMLAGELTAKVVFGAIQSAAADTAEEFQKVPLGLNAAFASFTNNFALVVHEINKGVQGSQALASVMQSVADTVLTVPNDLRVAFTAVFAQIDQLAARVKARFEILGINISELFSFRMSDEEKAANEQAIQAINARRDASISASKAAVDAAIDQEVRLVREKAIIAESSGVANTPAKQAEQDGEFLKLLEDFNTKRQARIDKAAQKEIDSNKKKNDKIIKDERDRLNEQLDAVNATTNAIGNVIAATGGSSAAAVASIISQVAGMATTISTIMLAQAQAQTYADVSAPTLGQKIANTAILTAQFAGIFASIQAAKGGGRLMGGPTSGMLAHPINESGVPEVYKQGGRQYLLPTGSNGEIAPLSGGSGGGGAPNITVVNSGPPLEVTGTNITRGEVKVMVKSMGKAVKNEIVGSLKSGRGDTFNALQKSTQIERNING